MNNCSQKTISILAESETDYQSVLSYPAKKVIYIVPTVTNAVIKSAASTRNKGLKQQVTVQRVITKKGHGGGGGRYAPRREYR